VINILCPEPVDFCTVSNCTLLIKYSKETVFGLLFILNNKKIAEIVFYLGREVVGDRQIAAIPESIGTNKGVIIQ
jgi:hypothetical protein